MDIAKELEQQLKKIEEEKLIALGAAQKNVKQQNNQESNLIQEVQEKFKSIDQNDFIRMQEMRQFNNAISNVNNGLLDFIKSKYASEFAQTPEGEKLYRDLIGSIDSAINDIKILKQNELKDLQEFQSSKNEFQEFLKLKREGKL